jgi:hypothetical protein
MVLLDKVSIGVGEGRKGQSRPPSAFTIVNQGSVAMNKRGMQEAPDGRKKDVADEPSCGMVGAERVKEEGQAPLCRPGLWLGAGCWCILRLNSCKFSN